MRIQPFNDPNEVHREVVTVRLPTETRDPVRIIVSQIITAAGDLALCSITIHGLTSEPLYYEKPDILEDLAIAIIRATGHARKWNYHVKSGSK